MVSVLTLVVSFVLIFTIGFSLYHCLQNFIQTDSTIALLIILVASLFLSVINSILVAVRTHRTKSGKIGFWASKNYPKLVLAYVILILCLMSVSNSVDWTADTVNEVITIEWTIFGLSLTIFLVWNVLIVDYLKKKQPVVSDGLGFIQRYELLLKKQSFSQEVDNTFSTVVLMTINLVLLLFSTSLAYLSHLSETVFTQVLIRCTFFFTTNTIFSLFIDLLRPLKKDRDALKKNNVVTKEELDTAEAGAMVYTILEAGVKAISEISGLDDAQKRELSTMYIEGMRDALLEKAKSKNPNNENK